MKEFEAKRAELEKAAAENWPKHRRSLRSLKV